MALDVDVLVFDVFGTVVDWRGSIIMEGETRWKTQGLDVEWGAFADEWRAGYQPAMDKIRSGEAKWASIDALHRQILDGLLDKYQITHLTESQTHELNHIWHRLQPWADSVAGIQRLREDHTVTTLSNGNMSLLVALSKQAGLQWDCILSAELAHHYKPDLETYRMACALLDVSPERALMVASHRGDLLASRQIGMKTAFVRRPLEYGANGIPDDPDPQFDLVVDDFLDLHRQLDGSG
ncbi:MAG: haloacid dehalogenase type II [Aggregatilineales bacterium]